LIKVNNLTKQYGQKTAIDKISFNIERGKIYGFLGQNGAGKSTTMNIITGCLAATEGSVTVAGKDIFKHPTEAKKHIGYLPEIPPLYVDMTPFEYLSFVAEAKGLNAEETYRQVNEAMKVTSLEDVSDRLIKTLSKGYKQRVGIAQALLGSPDVIILDEPTVGLDPRQITEIRALIRSLGETRTVIISSHILAEISEVCDHVIIISHGKIVADGSIKELEASVNKTGKLTLTLKCGVNEAAEILDGVSSLIKYEGEEKDNGYSVFTAEYAPENDPSEQIFYAFANKNIAIYNMNHEKLTLEDIFLKLTDEAPADYVSEALDIEEKEDYTPLFKADENESVEAETAEKEEETL
jgi:ABC-2 type transport system ATP-binding protein